MLNESIVCWSDSFHFVLVGILVLVCILPHGAWAGLAGFNTWIVMDMTSMTMLHSVFAMHALISTGLFDCIFALG